MEAAIETLEPWLEDEDALDFEETLRPSSHLRDAGDDEATVVSLVPRFVSDDEATVVARVPLAPSTLEADIPDETAHAREENEDEFDEELFIETLKPHRPAASNEAISNDGLPRDATVRSGPVSAAVPVTATRPTPLRRKPLVPLYFWFIAATPACVALLLWIVTGGEQPPTSSTNTKAASAPATIPTAPPVHSSVAADRVSIEPGNADDEDDEDEIIILVSDEPAEPAGVGPSVNNSANKSSASASPEPTPKAERATALLQQARAAYDRGEGAVAYRLATRSHGLAPTWGAAELATTSACAMQDLSKAKEALKGVALVRRGVVRGICKNHHGQRLRL